MKMKKIFMCIISFLVLAGMWLFLKQYKKKEPA